ncbi:Mitochondrial fission protein ELM1 [Quillaja saponaria]|uniref:Mitochondrial fission protein ELM1 n=1 Tax=Quillaja saponaria TaxID=32244 RepID=A0AAD7KY30_QUISA|nr:Mitochondrial fission protein ELM1 [Quillaja saponaria]
MGVIRRAVVIGNGFPNSENQSIGLVRALGLSDKNVLYRISRYKGGINEWLHWLPVSLHKRINHMIRHFRGYSQSLLTSQGKQLTPQSSETGVSAGLDGPLLVVASGRDTISIASSTRQLASENDFVVQILHPRLQLNRFDLVITPRHDYYPLTPSAREQVFRFLRTWITPHEPPDNHVVLTVGALHQIDFATLHNSASAWHDEFAPLPKPLLVVNTGGPTRNCRYDVDIVQLTASILSVLVSCGSVRLSFSDKTPQKVSDVIIRELGNNPKVYIWDGQDSVIMISEACCTGKPVYVMGAELCRWKLAEFHRTLRELGVARPFTGSEDMSENWSCPPLNDTGPSS